jgi:hypothetical protein
MPALHADRPPAAALLEPRKPNSAPAAAAFHYFTQK